MSDELNRMKLVAWMRWVGLAVILGFSLGALAILAFLRFFKIGKRVTRFVERHIPRLSPGYALYSLEGDLAKHLQRFEDAISAYHKVLSITHTDRDALVNLGECLYRLKRYKEAIAVFRKLPNQRLANPRILKFLGSCYNGTDRFDEAIQALEEAIRLSKRPCGFMFLELGYAYRMKDQNEKAIENFRKAAELDVPEELKSELSAIIQRSHIDAEFLRMVKGLHISER